MKYRVRYLQEAVDELAVGKGDYEAKERGLGIRFAREAVEAGRRAARNPYIYQVAPYVDDPTIRRVLVRSFPWLLFYRVRDDVIEIIAAAPGKEDPAQWLVRLSRVRTD